LPHAAGFEGHDPAAAASFIRPLALAGGCWHNCAPFRGHQAVSHLSLGFRVMSKVCQVTGKRPIVGNTVSHANNRRRRRFEPNLHKHRFWLESEKRFVSLRVSAAGMRLIDKKGVDVVIAELRARGEKV
jgi:large subunit ribosomal protein L28